MFKKIDSTYSCKKKLFVFAGAIFLLILLWVSISFFPDRLAIIQVAAMLPIIFLLWSVLSPSTAYHKFLLSLVFLSAIALIACKQLCFTNSGILLTRLEGDLHGAKTAVFRETVERSLQSHTRLELKSLSQSYSEKEIHKLLQKRTGVRAAITGDKHRLKLIFPILNVETLLKQNFSPEKKIHLITAIPSATIPFQPASSTATFLASLVYAIQQNNEPDRELALQNVALMGGLWSGYAHRSYPAWLLGNEYFLKAQKTPGDQRGLWRCAAESYKLALGFLRPGDNPALRVAILHNYAILIRISRDIQHYNAAKQFFQLAREISAQADTTEKTYFQRVKKIIRKSEKSFSQK